jgi:hypothetical protein
MIKVKLFLLKYKFNNWKLRLTKNKFICKFLGLKTNKSHDNLYDNDKNSNDKTVLATKNNFKININSKSVIKIVSELSPYENFEGNLLENGCDEKVSLKKEDDLYIRFVSFIQEHRNGNKIPTAKELETVFEISERKRRKFMEQMELDMVDPFVKTIF